MFDDSGALLRVPDALVARTKHARRFLEMLVRGVELPSVLLAVGQVEKGPRRRLELLALAKLLTRERPVLLLGGQASFLVELLGRRSAARATPGAANAATPSTAAANRFRIPTFIIVGLT